MTKRTEFDINKEVVDWVQSLHPGTDADFLGQFFSSLVSDIQIKYSIVPKQASSVTARFDQDIAFADHHSERPRKEFIVAGLDGDEYEPITIVNLWHDS